MKSILILLFALAISFDAMAAEPYLRNVILSGKLPPSISNVLWSEQPEVCVVQITFRPTKSTQQPEKPETQVWLLTRNGNCIPRNDISNVGISNAGLNLPMRSYVFPKSAAKEAYAVALEIGDSLLISKLNHSNEEAKQGAPATP